jgi:hypothetical protein
MHYDHPITQMMLYYKYYDPVNYLLVLILSSHSYQISFKVGVCHPCKLNFFVILSKLSNIITIIIISLADNLTLSTNLMML